MAKNAKRKLVNLGISPEASKAADDMADSAGMLKTEVCSRVILWLAKVSKNTRSSIIGDLTPDAEAVVLAKVLRDMGYLDAIPEALLSATADRERQGGKADTGSSRSRSQLAYRPNHKGVEVVE